MDLTLERELDLVAIECFEEVCSVLPVLGLSQGNRNTPLEGAMSVNFSGSLNGELIVAVYGNILSTLTAKMMDLDDFPTENEKRDAFGEITNTICGNILPYIIGFEGGYTMGTPKAIVKKRWPFGRQEFLVARVIEPFEQGWADLLLFVDEPLPTDKRTHTY